jgi:hypothetical protein
MYHKSKNQLIQEDKTIKSKADFNAVPVNAADSENLDTKNVFFASKY